MADYMSQLHYHPREIIERLEHERQRFARGMFADEDPNFDPVLAIDQKLMRHMSGAQPLSPEELGRLTQERRRRTGAESRRDQQAQAMFAAIG